MEVGTYPMNMPISLSKEKQIMEDNDKLFKEWLCEKESYLMALANNILVEVDVELNKRQKRILEIRNSLMKGLKETNVPLNSGPSFQPAGNHIIKVSTTEELEKSDFNDTTMVDNQEIGGDSNGNSSSMEAVESVTVEIGDDPNQDDSVYWTRLHGLVLKISGGGVVKLWLSDVGSRESFTFRVIAVMDIVAFVTSFVGNTVGDKYPNLSKVLGLVGAPAAIFMVVASLTEYAYPEYTILIPAIASLPPLLALADRAFSFNKSLPRFLASTKKAFTCNTSLLPFLPRMKRAFSFKASVPPFVARMKRAFGFNASPPSPDRAPV